MEYVKSATLNSFLSIAYQIAPTFLTFCFVVSLLKLHALLYILCAVNTNTLIFCSVIYRDIICVLIRKPQNLYMLTRRKIHTKKQVLLFTLQKQRDDGREGSRYKGRKMTSREGR